MTDFSLLPATLAPTTRSDRSDIVSLSGCTTIQELVEAGSISARILSDSSVEIECQDQGIVLTEPMRADFDNDGVEEILLESRFYVKFVTLRFLRIDLLRKNDAVAPFEYQSWDCEIEAAQHRHQIARIMR